MNAQLPIEFLIRHISTDQFAILEDNYSRGEDFVVQFGAQIQYGLSPENKIIITTFSFDLVQKQNKFIVLTVSCHFQISEPSWQTFVSNPTEYRIPKDFAIHLGILTVGTARGILHAKTENSNFNQFIIPTINLIDMVSDDVVLKNEITSTNG